MMRILLKYLLFLSISLILFACESDEEVSVNLYEPGTVDARASTTQIKYGEGITFTDLSTKVHTRKWVFEGGDPATSRDSVVVVNYPKGGSFKAVLEVVFIDNQKGTFEFNIEVEKNPNEEEIPEYDFGEMFGLYTESSDISNGLASVVTIDMNNFPATKTNDSYEGVEAYVFKATGESDWAMGALQAGGDQYTDFSPFVDGYYHVALKSECQADILLRIRSSGGGNVIFEFTAEGEEYGFKRDGLWHLISIPMADIVAKDTEGNLNLSQITEFLLFRSAPGDVREFDNYEFYVDHIFLSEKMELKE